VETYSFDIASKVALLGKGGHVGGLQLSNQVFLEHAGVLVRMHALVHGSGIAADAEHEHFTAAGVFLDKFGEVVDLVWLEGIRTGVWSIVHGHEWQPRAC